MSLGGEIDYATTLGHALDQLAEGVDHVNKTLAEAGLTGLDNAELISAMQRLEEIRNRMPLADHALIGEAENRNLPDALTQPSMIRVLMSVLRLSPGGGSPAGAGRSGAGTADQHARPTPAAAAATLSGGAAGRAGRH